MIFGRDHELAALHVAYADMLLGRGSVLFLTGEAGLGKTTLVHAWAKERDAHERSQRESIAAESQQYPLGGTASTLFLEAACSIPIGNVDVGRLEALQPWADVVAQLYSELSAESNGVTTRSTDSDKNSTSDKSADLGKSADAGTSAQKGTAANKIDIRKLMRDAAPAWLWALPFVGEVAHAALVTARLVQDQRAGVQSQIPSPTAPDPTPQSSADPSVSPLPTSVTNTSVLEDGKFAASTQDQVFQQYVNFLTKISEATPLVIFLDDLHWADTSSSNLLFYLSRQIAVKKILVVATYRHDDALSANDGKGHAIITVKNEILRYSTGKELALSYLNRDSIRAFLSNTFTAIRADGTSISYVADEKFESWLHRISDGNALFMTQFVKTLCEDGHLDDEGKFVGDYATVTIPSSALAVVEERTRRLDDDTRTLLMYATAEGEEFTSHVLSLLTEKKPMQLMGELKKAQRIGLIVDRGTSRAYANQTTAIFGFSHALFHKALYDSLTEYEQHVLHRQCFDILKSEWDRVSDAKTRTATLATKLLTHAKKCEAWETVAEVALASAQEFWKAFNERETVEMITQVLAACDKVDGLTTQRAEALFLRGGVGLLKGRFDEALADYQSAEIQFRIADNTKRAVDAVNMAAWMLYRSISYDDALETAEKTAAESRTIGHVKGESTALSIIGSTLTRRGAHDTALASFERALALCVGMDDKSGEASLLINIANLLTVRGDKVKAMSYLERSVSIETAIGNRRGEAEALASMGRAYHRMDDQEKAIVCYERSLTIFSTVGDRLGEADIFHSLGIVHTSLGDHSQATSCFDRCLATYSSIGNRGGEAKALLNIGVLLINRGMYEQALSHFERSLALHVEIGDRLGEAYSSINLGWVLRILSRVDEARHYLHRSLAMAQSLSAGSVVAASTGELGLVAEASAMALDGLERTAKLTEARRYFEDAVILYRELHQDADVAKWENELARISH